MQLETLAETLNSIIAQLEKVRDSLATEGKIKETKAKMPPEVAERIEKRICLICGKALKDDKKPVRGVHNKCYTAMRRLNLDDEQMEAEGLLAPKLKGGRKKKPIPEALKKFASTSSSSSADEPITAVNQIVVDEKKKTKKRE